jgi:linoleoyl-CoA desaturase
MSSHIYKIHDKIYDLIEFVKIHPGGEEMFDNLIPHSNITPMIYAYHKDSIRILAMLPKYMRDISSNIIIHYDTNYTYDRYREVKKRILDEMYEHKIPLSWSNEEITYNMAFVSAYMGLWGYCYWNTNKLSYWWMIFMGILTVGGLIPIFHETSHHTGFTNQSYNRMFAINFPFANIKHWRQRHNYLHHCFTDSKYDCDMLHEMRCTPIRYSKAIPLREIHKYQYLYIYLLWLIGAIASSTHHYFSIIQSNKLIVCILLYQFGVTKTLLLFTTIGFHFLVIANLSHIHHECIDLDDIRKNDFLYNQVSSATNYVLYDPFSQFLCFGLDIQIEHHLFPNIPHSSLRKIKPIVRDYCIKNDIPYIEHPSIFHALISYMRYMYNMGQKEYR